MKKVQKKKQVFEATRWYKMQDHPMVIGWPGAVEGDCRCCNKPLSKHGMLFNAIIICPGDWIVIDPDGGTKKIEHREFERDYEPVAEDG